MSSIIVVIYHEPVFNVLYNRSFYGKDLHWLCPQPWAAQLSVSCFVEKTVYWGAAVTSGMTPHFNEHKPTAKTLHESNNEAACH